MKKLSRRQFLRTASVLMAATVLTACGATATSSSSGASVAASSAATSDTATDVKTYKFAYAYANMDENNMRTLKGIQMYVDELNATGKYDIEFLYTDAQSQVDKQIADVESLIAQQPDLILMSAVDTVGSIPCLQAIHNAGIIAVDDRGCDTEYKDVKFTGFDEDNIGLRLQEAVRTYLEQNPDINLKAGGIYGLAAQSEQLKRVDYLKALAEEMPDRLEIIETQYCDWSTDRATSTVEDWMQRYPEMNAIFTASDDMGLGACNALTASGREDVLVTSVDGTQIGLQLATAADQYFITIAANQEAITRHQVDFFMEMIDGTYTEPEYKCPPECFAIVTPDNVATVDMGSI
ncbi:MAG: substrate-binding domain-containing protein [Gemmiger sp.]|nr:substrate-binding domain-containing protein [Gemmiger sp.]